MTCSILTSVLGQALPPEKVEIVRSLQDGSYIVKIDNVLYKALPPNDVKQILLDRNELRVLKEDYQGLEAKFNIYKQLDSQRIAARDSYWGETIQQEQSRTTFWKGEYEKELALRSKYEKNMKSCSGKLIFFRLCTF
jgi:hypothetical protein